MEACTVTSRRSASEPGTLATANDEAAPIRSVSTVPEIVPGNSRSWMPNECTHRSSRSAAHQRSQRPWFGARVARICADERRCDRACARGLRRVVGRHLIRCGRGGRSRRRRAAGDRHDQDEQQRGVGRRRMGEPSLRRCSAGLAVRRGGMLANGGAGRAAAVGLRIGRGKSGLRQGRVLGRPRRGRPRGSATEKRPPPAARGAG